MRACLIVANQSLASPTLAQAVTDRLGSGVVRFHVVVPATHGSRGLTWDEDAARTAAQHRLDEALERLRELGSPATGEVGSPDPVAAAMDALRSDTYDEVILSTLAPGISRWLGQDVPTRLRNATDVPVIVVISPADALERQAG
jgi:nucleotide-binding universal stress UspA family protein